MPQNVAFDRSLRYLPYTQQYFKTHHQVVEWTISNFSTSMVPILMKNMVQTLNIKMLVPQSTSVMHVNKLKIQVDKLLKKKKKKRGQWATIDSPAYLQMPCNSLPVLPQQLGHKSDHTIKWSKVILVSTF